MLFVGLASALAQQSSTGHWFAGVERGTETPAVAHAPPPERRSRQPSYYNGSRRVVQAQAQSAPRSATSTESLPLPSRGSPIPPQSTTPATPGGDRIQGTLPISGWDADVDIAQGANGRIDRLVVRDASLSKVLSLLAQTYHLNIVAANDIDAVISITLRDVRLEEALTAILSVANYTWVERDGIIMITSLSDSDLPPGVQGRSTEIFDLNFVSASVISETVSNLLSSIGKMSVVEADPTDNRRTREMIVVEDIPEAIARISNYVCRVDCPPRQVLIEAHILQVTLKDTEKNGVNFNALFRVAGAKVNIISIPSLAAVPIPSPGVSPSAPSTPAVLATVAGTDLQAVIDLLQTTNQTKTLGSPKVLVLNQQEATIHVGEDLGYQTTVITELQTTQAPQFLQIGVLLRITPRITRDNRVLLHVRPEVSTGNIDPVTQVPNKRTTELETDVMLQDGEGMVIGGLIDEQDITNQTKWLGSDQGPQGSDHRLDSENSALLARLQRIRTGRVGPQRHAALQRPALLRRSPERTPPARRQAPRPNVHPAASELAGSLPRALQLLRSALAALLRAEQTLSTTKPGRRPRRLRRRLRRRLLSGGRLRDR
jgi:hypothetical protein